MKRYEELDSLRGIAALIVVIYHVLIFNAAFLYNTYGNSQYELLNWLKYSPLRVFFIGEEAVIMFFVLSGFVLALPFFSGRQKAYDIYLIKRICRIYLPYIMSIGIAVFAILTFQKGLVTGYETGTAFSSAINFKLFLEHVFMIGEYDSSAINPPIWSLIHEMRISIIFPLLMLIVLKFKWKKAILSALALSVIGLCMSYIVPTEKFTISYAMTVHYSGMFIVGAVMAKYRENLVDFFKNRNFYVNSTVLITGVLLITYRWWFFYEAPYIHHFVINHWVAVAGVVILIIGSMSITGLSKILRTKPLMLLGKISYSLYLVHMIVAYVVIKSIGEIVSFPIVALIIIGASLLTAYVFSEVVENSSIKIGKRLSDMRERQKRAKVNEETVKR